MPAYRMCIAGVGLAILSVRVAAVDPGQPSKTSIMVAAARAFTARDYDPSVRNPDWLAEHFLGPAERGLLPDEPIVRALDEDYRTASARLPNPGMFLVRTRFLTNGLSRRYARVRSKSLFWALDSTVGRIACGIC
jgi:hypothetical protein